MYVVPTWWRSRHADHSAVVRVVDGGVPDKQLGIVGDGNGIQSDCSAERDAIEKTPCRRYVFFQRPVNTTLRFEEEGVVA